MESATSAVLAADVQRRGTVAHQALSCARALAKSLERIDFTGFDPYDALRSPALRTMSRTPLFRRLAIQTVKHSPWNFRPLLGVTPDAHTKALALCASAYTRLAQLEQDEEWLRGAAELAERLLDRSVKCGAGLGWAYDFDVQTRWAFYRRGEPNAIATAFAVDALVDIGSLSDRADFLAAAEGGAEFACSSLLVESASDAYFSYFDGSTVPIHNANVLVARAVLRAAQAATQLQAVERAFGYTLQRQRPDGSWPYGEWTGLRWVDGFHTAYVLDCLHSYCSVSPSPSVKAALETGLDLYLRKLLDRDGAPRASVTSRFPLDVHAAASAITTLCRLRGEDERTLPAAERVFKWARNNLLRPDGRFGFQRHRWWYSDSPFVRWGDAHMLLALSELAGTGDD
jgi:hypothetical protein